MSKNTCRMIGLLTMLISVFFLYVIRATFPAGICDEHWVVVLIYTLTAPVSVPSASVRFSVTPEPFPANGSQ